MCVGSCPKSKLSVRLSLGKDQAAEAEAAKPAGPEAEAAAARRMMVRFETLDENGEPVRR